MLSDNEARADYVNFTGVAESVADLVRQSRGEPISIGISGTWGIGKSSMLRLTESALQDGDPPPGRTYVYVDFNAWLYQDFDDARTALLDVVATSLQHEAESRKGTFAKVAEFRKRINWLRVARLGATGLAAVAVGATAPGALGLVYGASQALKRGLDADSLEQTDVAIDAAAQEAKSLVRAPRDESPPEEISALRKSFEEALDELEVQLVVFIDDLDRCLPPTTISTLEAIRLLLFMRNTAFVIAADDEMVRFAVRKHYEGLPSSAAAINYFDKLIQVPIRVPPLGTQEVRAYMLMLAIEDSGELVAADLDNVRRALQKQLRSTWKGAVVDRDVVTNAGTNMSAELLSRLDMVLRLAPMMTSAPTILGNPRLIKRFMVALSIRTSMAKSHEVVVDQPVLAKLLLFERLGSPAAYAALVGAVTSSAEGQFAALESLEAKAKSNEALEFPWSEPFMRDWLATEPSLAGADLRGALYVGRETTRLVSPDTQLSSAAQEALQAILLAPVEGTKLARLADLDSGDVRGLLSVLLQTAANEHVWGVPPVLTPLIEIASLDAQSADQVVAFLTSRPSSELMSAIVPKIRNQAWSEAVFRQWAARTDLPGDVRRAMPDAPEGS